jgi:hypothetical protein
MTLDYNRQEASQLDARHAELMQKLGHLEAAYEEMRYKNSDRVQQVHVELDQLRYENDVYASELDYWERVQRVRLDSEIQAYRSLLNYQLKLLQQNGSSGEAGGVGAVGISALVATGTYGGGGNGGNGGNGGGRGGNYNIGTASGNYGGGSASGNYGGSTSGNYGGGNYGSGNYGGGNYGGGSTSGHYNQGGIGGSGNFNQGCSL